MYIETDTEYVYTLVREDIRTGEQAKRNRKYYSFTPCFEVGGLYSQLGKGYPGYQRVLSVEKKLVPTYYVSKRCVRK